MNIAILSDIHANSDALEKVLEDANANQVKKIFILGDFIGYYYQPHTVLEKLEKWDFEFIQGNHELILKKLVAKQIEIDAITKQYGSGHALALKLLTENQMQSLFTAPQKKTITIDNITFIMCHGSPWANDCYLYPTTELKILQQCDAMVDFVFVGHSHYQFQHQNFNSKLINVGSVGQSRQQGGIANWVLVNTITKKYELKATPYDTEHLLKSVKYYDSQNDYLSQVLIRKKGI